MVHPPDSDERTLDRDWFYHRAGTEYGPMSREDLAESLRLIPLDEVSVWHPSLPSWVHSNDAAFRSLVLTRRQEVADRPGLGALLFSFKGRLRRAKYLWTYLFAFTPYLAAVAGGLAATHATISSDTGVLLRLALAPPFLWIGLALTAKRLHDLDLSAWHLLWVAPATASGALVSSGSASGALAILNGVVELWLVLKRGTSGPNRYGSDPMFTGARDAPIMASSTTAGWGPATGLTALGLIAVIAYAISVTHPSTFNAFGQIECSRRDILDTTKTAIINDPSETLALMMLGGSGNIRMTLNDVRTLSYDRPLHGVTCAATVSTVPIDRERAANKSGGDSTVTYTVQSTDANDGRYVVTILSD